MVTPHKVASSNPSWDEFPLVGKKSLSLCSPQGLALSGMGQGSGVFPRPGEAVLLPLNEKQWGPFTPWPHFFLSSPKPGSADPSALRTEEHRGLT